MAVVIVYFRVTASDYPCGIFKVFVNHFSTKWVLQIFENQGATCRTGTDYLPEHMILSPVFSGVHVARAFIFCVVFFFFYHCSSFCPVSFGHCIVFLRFTASAYPCGIFKLSLKLHERCLTYINTCFPIVETTNMYAYLFAEIL